MTAATTLRVDLDETEISQVEIGQAVRITLDAFPDQKLEGRVSDIDFLGDNTRVSCSTRSRVELSPTALAINRSNDRGGGDIVVDNKANVLLVPNRALRRDLRPASALRCWRTTCPQRLRQDGRVEQRV